MNLFTTLFIFIVVMAAITYPLWRQWQADLADIAQLCKNEEQQP